MIDDDVVQLALRNKLATLMVASTGLISLASSAAGGEDGASAFVRTAGSFKTDGLRVGMEADASGFNPAKSNNGAATITALSPNGMIATVAKFTALGVPIVPALSDEAAASGRMLYVGLPKRVEFEDVKFDAMQGRPYVGEQYIPGPSHQRTNSPNGILEVEPMYIVTLYIPKGSGIGADSKYVNALRRLFAPGTPIPLSTGDTLIVRREPAPYKDQRVSADVVPGFVLAAFNIPLRLHTPNSL